jgi:hypothetical protein
MHHILAVPKNSSSAFDVCSFCLNRKENDGKIINPKVRHAAIYQPKRTEYFFIVVLVTLFLCTRVGHNAGRTRHCFGITQVIFKK